MAQFKDIIPFGKKNHPYKEEFVIAYGTAGFRSKASDLDHVIFRMGMLAVLRSKAKKATIGVMITASHNPVCDNGVKLIDPLGEMLHVSWEKHATELANLRDEDIPEYLEKFVASENIDLSQPSNVVFARDTRPSSESLAKSLADGVTILLGDYKDYGLLTTPQLHYMVRCINTQGQYGQPTQEGYYTKLMAAFKQLTKTVDCGHYIPNINIDGANGVGAVKMKEVQVLLGKHLKVNIYNDGTNGELNHMCGADYVKVQQKVPQGMPVEKHARYCSFDGDADRIVFFYQDLQGEFHLLDGDKIATLVAGYLQQLVTDTGLSLNLGLVQTAYANGSSTAYITQTLQIPVACVPTGVKHLHHKAQDFDIGVYFEANGHGTVLFSDTAMDKIQCAVTSQSISEAARASAVKLQSAVDLINQTVGDAISDLLLVEAVLSNKGWSAEDWDQAYTDLPNRQLKVKVEDRTVIQTIDAERRVTSPEGLQAAIDAAVTKFPNGRSFVRPSGTEDVVRVYAEADTRSNADLLAVEVSVKVHGLAGGVGEPPSINK